MKIKQVATAFISHDDKWLVMKRSDDRTIAPGYWYGVGGHIEKGEHADPEMAVRREIREETGLEDSDIRGLRLRLIVIRRSSQETVINFVYTAAAARTNVVSSKEGELFWVTENELLNRKFVDVIHHIIVKLIADNEADDMKSQQTIFVGVMRDADSPAIQWIELTEWPTLF